MFEGFSQEALDFLNDIRFNNNQAFYAANQARYERFVKRPMRELSDELAPVVQLIDPKLDTRPGRTMSRIRRDTRYTKDKSPFRDHAWLGWRYPGEGRGEGFHMYWGFGPDWLGWGCGCYYPDKPLMDALRLHIRKEADDVRRCLRALDGRFEMRMAPLHQLMRRMRDEAEHAAQEAVREREARARAEAQTGAAKPGRLVVRSADEFEF